MNKTISYLLLTALLTGLCLESRATHNRAGEITYTQIDELTYEIIITTYTYTLSPADRNELTVQWGDGTFSTAERYREKYLPGNYKRNKYRARHTFPGAGTYELVVQDPNRNDGVLNIPNSVRTMFAIKTVMQINPSLGFNNTPQLLTEPIDKAAVNEVFMHNPAAFDPDGDSLSYALTPCLADEGTPIEDYSLPPASDSIGINPVTGDLVWSTPTQVGLYNIAIEISEWREGVRIGKVIRDMQIDVVESENEPPEFDSVPPICVMAGELIEFTVTARDSVNEELSLDAYGGPFQVANPANFSAPEEQFGQISGTFSWQTQCSHVRKQAYSTSFKATDDHPEVKLTSFLSVPIQVVAPAPEDLMLSPTNSTITLNWGPSPCPNAEGYLIYRRKNSRPFEPGPCQTGVPDSLGYTLIDTVTGVQNTTYLDHSDQNANGQETGLWQGVEYCYRVTAYFADGAESYTSNEACATLVRGIPAITNVDIKKTATQDGEIFVRWAYPTEFDSLAAPGPYLYKVYHSEGFWGEQFELVDSVMGLKNTEYLHSGPNTQDGPHSYMVVFWNITPGNRFPVGTPQIASSPFLDVFSGYGEQLYLNYFSNTPWTDTSYVIYRADQREGPYDSIARVSSLDFMDTGLQNENTYYYKVKHVGFYSIQGEGVPNPIYNTSQINSGEVFDTIPPCIPELNVQSMCDDKYNQLNWQYTNDSCATDTRRYRIYFSEEEAGELGPVATVEDPEKMDFRHVPEKSLAGCYAVTAIDSFGNETELSNIVCVDECYYYELPNVFTPDGDGTNDVFKPFPYDFVEKVEMKVYNRWGKLVFKTTNPDIQWDGTLEGTNQKVPDGIYYYVCDVYEHRLSGLEERYMVGFVHIYSEDKPAEP